MLFLFHFLKSESDAMVWFHLNFDCSLPGLSSDTPFSPNFLSIRQLVCPRPATAPWWNCLMAASCVGGLHLYSCPPPCGRHGLSSTARISYSKHCSEQQGTISEQYPLCYSVIQTDWWINTTQTESVAHDCNTSYGSSPKGEGSAARASAAQFDSLWGW